MPIILALLFLLGGTGAAAQKSLPGDVLYPVKIHVNENIESAFAFTPKDDALVGLKHASQRVQEAEKLASKGSLTAEADTEIKTNLFTDVEDVRKAVSSLRQKGDTESADEIESELELLFNSPSLATGTVVFLPTSGGEDAQGSVSGSNTTRVSQKKESDDGEGRQSIESGRIKSDDDENESENNDDDIRISTSVKISATTTSATATATSNTTFSMSQVKSHNTASSCYTVVNGSVYNLTSWIGQHPGGEAAILGLCGTDGTQAFLAQHGGQGKPEQELASFKIGVLAQ